MYFDLTPKDKRSDLFGFDEECKQLKKALEGTSRLIVIKGLRRTGKTSLMNVVYNEITYPKIYLDMRELVPLTQENFARHLYISVIEIMSKMDLFKSLLTKIKSVEIGVKIGIKEDENSLSIILRKMNTTLEEKKQKLVIFIDEAQLMKQILVDNLFAFVYDHLKNIKMVFAGSEVGILDKMLEEERSPLFGRPYLEIRTEPISNESARRFLINGFKQTTYKPSDEEFNKIIEKTDGIIGWLTLAGYNISFYKNLEKGLKKTEETATKIVLSELENFFENRKTAKQRYLTILKGLSKQPLGWADTKMLTEIKFGKISNNKFTKYMHALKDYGFITHNDGLYYIVDNLLKEVLK